MPIRMVEDEPQQNNNDSNRGRGGGGGLNLGCLMMFLPYLLKRPKLLIPLLIIGALAYFFVLPNLSQNNGVSLFGMGGLMKQEIFDKAEVFEPLANNGKNILPERISLEKYCPERLNQGSQGSCVAWSSAYAARTIQAAMSENINPNTTKFSPSYLYNQIALENCQGAYIHTAMELMQKQGLAKFDDFPYDENDCKSVPNKSLLSEASQFKTKGYNRLTKNGDDYTIDLLAIKQNLAQGAPVVIGMMVGPSFMQPMLGRDAWSPDEEDYSLRGMGGHAMCVIGYDDVKNGGAFQIMNSWGKEWGINGIGWVKYADFKHFTKEAYGLYPMGAAIEDNIDLLKVKFGLIENENNKMISLTKKSENIFSTSNTIKKGTKFKVEIENEAACYIYIFGKETDNSAYTLFPYTSKHSPYCGIIGSRIFPRDYSMMADEISNQDEIAVLIAKKPIDYIALTKSLNESKQLNFATRFFDLIQSITVKKINYQSNDYIGFETKLNGKNTVGFILQIDKN